MVYSLSLFTAVLVLAADSSSSALPENDRVILTNAFKAMDSDGDKVVSHVEMVVFLNR